LYNFSFIILAYKYFISSGSKVIILLCLAYRLCLDCIGKNAIILESQISLLPPKLLQQVLKKITFWTAANHREEQRAQKEETENKYQWISSN